MSEVALYTHPMAQNEPAQEQALTAVERICFAGIWAQVSGL